MCDAGCMAQTERHRTQGTFDPAVLESEAALADRLDRLSAPLAENVLRRAIEIHQEEEFADNGSVSFAELAKVAGELGIDAATLQRALVEQLDTGTDDSRSLLDFLLGPKRITGGKVAEGDSDAVAARVDEWMRELETMYPTQKSGASTTWEPAGDTGRLAGALATVLQDRLQSRQTQLASGDQLIEIEIDMAKNRRAWAAVAAMLAAIGAVAGGFTAGNEAFASNLVEFLIPFGIGSGGGVVLALVGARSTAAHVRKQVNRALGGIVNLATLGRRGSATD